MGNTPVDAAGAAGAVVMGADGSLLKTGSFRLVASALLSCLMGILLPPYGCRGFDSDDADTDDADTDDADTVSTKVVVSTCFCNINELRYKLKSIHTTNIIIVIVLRYDIVELRQELYQQE
jgi:hypothetical protein